jgi:anthranilate phosphoribosyltransferase
VDEAAKIFKSVLENQSTRAQKEVAIANAAMALYCADSAKGLETAVGQGPRITGVGQSVEMF